MKEMGSGSDNRERKGVSLRRPEGGDHNDPFTAGGEGLAGGVEKE